MAIPFNVPRQQSSGDTAAIAHQHYLRIENLLMELLSMLRWTPWATMYGKCQLIIFSVSFAPRHLCIGYYYNTFSFVSPKCFVL